MQALAARRGSSVDTSSPRAFAPDDLTALIQRLHGAAARTWAPVDLPVAAFARHLATCVASSPVVGDPLQAVDSLCTDDVYLACAAGLDITGARDLFVRRYLGPLAAAVRSIDPTPVFVDEVRQALHESLLLGTPGCGAAPASSGEPLASGGSGPRILQYAGRAPLASWLSVAARRTALGLLRADSARHRALERAAEEPLPVELDPELQYLKERYRGAFKEALCAALASLGQRQRTVMKLHTVSGLTLARIGAMLGVDESTVSRWAQRAREEILLETHRQLSITLGVQVTEVPSLARLVNSQLDLSVARLLADDSSSQLTSSR